MIQEVLAQVDNAAHILTGTNLAVVVLLVWRIKVLEDLVKSMQHQLTKIDKDVVVLQTKGEIR